MIYTTIDNFYVSEEDLKKSPSRADGITEEVEKQLRIYGCEIIQEGGILLRLPQAVMATAQVLLQRFYCKESLLKYNVKKVAWACCWLATKLEEAPRKCREVLSVFIRIDRRRDSNGAEPIPPLDFYGSEYTSRKMEVIKVERHMLRTFGFILHVDHPHKVILNYLTLLNVSAEMKQEAWSLANDSLRTTLCVRYKSEVIACGLILLASRRLKYPLPDNPSWLELFQVPRKEVYTVAREVHTLFSMPKAKYISVYRESLNQQAQPNANQVSPGGANMTPQASSSETDEESRRDRNGDGSVQEISGTSGEPRSTDAREKSRDEEQRSGQRSAGTSEAPNSVHLARSAKDDDSSKSSHRRSRKRKSASPYDRRRSPSPRGRRRSPYFSDEEMSDVERQSRGRLQRRDYSPSRSRSRDYDRAKEWRAREARERERREERSGSRNKRSEKDYSRKERDYDRRYR